jgi:hypothetical protein
MQQVFDDRTVKTVVFHTSTKNIVWILHHRIVLYFHKY